MEPPRQEIMVRGPHFQLWDTISIIVGIVIATGIFQTPPSIFSLSDGPLQALGIWVLGGFLSVMGGLCFAELATTYPRSGGEYVYLTRAAGPWAGFLFAWGQMLIVRTGASVVPLAYILVDYALKLARTLSLDPTDDQHNLDPFTYAALALSPIAVLTLVNIIGVRSGKWTQNTLTAVKVFGLAGVIGAGAIAFGLRQPDGEPVALLGTVTSLGDDSLELQLSSGARRVFVVSPNTRVIVNDKDMTWGSRDGNEQETVNLRGTAVKLVTRSGEPFRASAIISQTRPRWALFSLSLILVLWTYAGWHEGAYVAAEVIDVRRNLPRALLGGSAIVIGLYLLVNIAFLAGLGYENAAASQAIGADLLGRVLGPWGESAMCVLVILSALGGISGMLVTNSRIFAEFGRDHPLFSMLGRWHPTTGTPVFGLLAQLGICAMTITMVAFVFPNSQAFTGLIQSTAPVFWIFFLATGFALFALRWQDPTIARPFPTPGYPLTPILYCAFCTLMLIGSLLASWNDHAGAWLGVLLLGLPLYWLTRCLPSRRTHAEPQRSRAVHPIEVQD